MAKPNKDALSVTPAAVWHAHRPAPSGALAKMLDLLRAGDSCVRLVGPRGVGKTALLHAIARALPASWRFVLVADPHSSPEELWAQSAGDLEVSGPPEQAVASAAASALARGGAILLLIDDAHLQTARARRLLARACAGEPGLRVLLCETEVSDGVTDEEAGRPGEVWLPEAVTCDDARGYLREWLSWKGVPENETALFDDDTIDELHADSDGNVASLLALSADLLSLHDPRIGVGSGSRGGNRTSSANPRRDLRLAAALFSCLVLLAGSRLIASWDPPAEIQGSPDSAPPSPRVAPSVAAAPPVSASGRLSVNAFPWAEIEIDGVPVGETPLGELELTQGFRHIVARFPDGQVVTRTVEVGRDEVFLQLRAAKPTEAPLGDVRAGEASE